MSKRQIIVNLHIKQISIKRGNMKNKLETLLRKFNIDGEIVSYNFLSSGHINTTCLVRVNVDGKTKEYVLQKINKYVFKKPDEVMKNISNVTNFIRNKIKANGESSRRRVLKFYKSDNDNYFTLDEEGDDWRIYRYVPNSVTYNETDDLTVLEGAGKAFGEFQMLLDDFPIKNLNIIIPHFHNTENRYKLFKEAIRKDAKKRVKKVQEEICEFIKLENLATKMYKLQKQGVLKLRVTHNDTKCNNVLFDEDTKKYLCAIDLDTVMPGLVGFDFGDAIRFAANTCSEDETDLSKVKIDLAKYEAFAKGFLSKVGDSLSEDEKNTLALGAVTMTLECGLRFLTDYIDGDKYFKTNHSNQNLDRARCQLSLAQDMIRNYEKMKNIIEDCTFYHDEKEKSLEQIK